RRRAEGSRSRRGRPSRRGRSSPSERTGTVDARRASPCARLEHRGGSLSKRYPLTRDAEGGEQARSPPRIVAGTRTFIWRGLPAVTRHVASHVVVTRDAADHVGEAVGIAPEPIAIDEIAIRFFELDPAVSIAFAAVPLHGVAGDRFLLCVLEVDPDRAVVPD